MEGCGRSLEMEGSYRLRRMGAVSGKITLRELLAILMLESQGELAILWAYDMRKDFLTPRNVVHLLSIL